MTTTLEKEPIRAAKPAAPSKPVPSKREKLKNEASQLEASIMAALKNAASPKPAAQAEPTKPPKPTVTRATTAAPAQTVRKTQSTQPPESKPAGRPANPEDAVTESIRAWLPSHCESLPGVCRGIALVADAGPDGCKVVASWPEGFAGNPGMKSMARIGFSGRSEAKRFRNATGPVDRVVMPITHEGRQLGALVVEADGLNVQKRQLLYGTINGNPPKTTSPEEAAGHRLAIVLELLSTCLDNERSQAAIMAFVTELANRTGCDRVSYGRINRRDRVRIVAISNSARVAERSNLVRGIEGAMEEAIDQGETVVFPRKDNSLIADREHTALSRMQGDSYVLTVPLAHDQKMVGAITLERHGTTPLGPGVVELCESLAVLAGPILELKHRDNQHLIGKTADSARSAVRSVVGPGHSGLKLGALIVAAVMTWLTFSTGTHRVTAPAQLEGSIHRAVIAPLDGFVSSADARAGDEVEEGQLLSRLDDSDLKLEVSKWKSEAEQLRKQHRGALAAHDRAETAILNARISRATAQLELLQSQLARTELRAPFNGIVVAGDLSQLLGSPVQRGDVLFEIAPLDDYRVVLEVDERDLASMRPGQSGHLAVEGLPGQSLQVTIDKITPVATARDGRNFFRVEARVDSAPDVLRPGMAGVAKIEIGERKRLWIWTHRIVDWVRLKLWTWLP